MDRPLNYGLLRLGGFIVAAAATILAFRGIIPKVANLYPSALPQSPYFVPSEALLLYLAMPLVVLAAFTFLLAPGLLAVFALGGASRIDALMLRSFMSAMILHIAVSSPVKILLMGGLSVSRFLTLQCTLIGVLFLLVMLRVHRGGAIAWPLNNREGWRRLLWILVISVLVCVAFLPAIFWQDMNGDGIEALYLGRSLSEHLTPRGPSNNGLMGFGAGLISSSLPIYWLVALFGPVEAAARLPLALYLPLLFCGVTALAELGSKRALTWYEEAAVVLALAGYTVAMAYNGSFNPYFADIAAPTVSDTFLIVVVLGAILSLWSARQTEFVLFCLLAAFARPTGLLIMIFLGIACSLLARTRRRELVSRVAVAVGLCSVVWLTYENLYLAYLSGGEAIAFQATSLLSRLQYLQFFDFPRLLWVSAPTGLLPAATTVFILFAPRDDALSRALAAVSAAYFMFFYIQAFVALHHFIPVMILPLVVFWRFMVARPARPAVVAIVALITFACVAASMPRHLQIHRTPRLVAATLDYRIGDFFHGSYSESQKAHRNSAVVRDLFPAYPSPKRNPADSWVAPPLALVYYASRFDDPTRNINYVIQLQSTPAPEGFSKVASRRGADAYVRDIAEWRRDRHRTHRTDYHSPLYKIESSTLLRNLGIREGKFDVNLGTWPVLKRLF
jgi:hypothetical protein